MHEIQPIILQNFDKTIKYACYNFLMPANTIFTIKRNSDTLEDHFFESKTFEYKKAKIVNQENFNCDWREIISIEFDCFSKYVPGDSIGILCPNDDFYVEKIIEILEINKNDILEIERTGLDAFKYSGTVFNFFKNVFDFKSLVKKSFLYSLVDVSEKKDELIYLCSKAGSVDYFSMYKNWNNLIEIFTFFESKPSLENLILHFNTIKPRFYSLTNKFNNNYKIIIGFLHNKDKTKYGHCSEYFKNNNAGDLKICYRENKLMRYKPSLKILMIATGTGIAPFLSFVSNEKVDYWLIYGCRTENDDLSKKINIRKDVVYSKNKIRVTDFMIQNIENIDLFIKKDCLVYVCGNINMQKEIINIFKEKFLYIIDEKRIFFDNWS
ncbi:hypothetical protein GVAV_002924 [Gurleya vavrai]